MSVAVIEAFSVKVEEEERERQAFEEPSRREAGTRDVRLASTIAFLFVFSFQTRDIPYKHLQTAIYAVPAVVGGSNFPRIPRVHETAENMQKHASSGIVCLLNLRRRGANWSHRFAASSPPAMTMLSAAS